MDSDRLKEHLTKRSQATPDYFKSGFVGLDNLIDGFYKGRVYVIGGWPGSGKSTMALNLISKLKGKSIVLFDTETSEERFYEKMLSLVSMVPYKEIRTNLSLYVNALVPHVDDVCGHKIKVYDLSCPSTKDIENSVKVDAPEVLIIDYFQNIDINSATSRTLGYSVAARDIERITKDYNIITILLSQLRRPTEEQTEPTIFDLKETNKLTEMAHAIMLLHGKNGSLKVTIGKNRDGSTGTVTMKGIWSSNKLVEDV